MKFANVEEQYARYPEMDRAEVQKIVEWVRTQPHLPEISELEAAIFFAACNYSVEMTKQVLDTNMTVRTHVAELFANMDCERPEMQRAMNTVALVPLPKRTPEGYRVLMCKLSDVNISHYNFADTLKLSNMIYDMWVLEDGIRIGEVIVIDLKGSTMAHVARVGILTMKKALFYLQEAAPVRIRNIHFINVIPIIDKIIALMNPFMKKELKSLLHYHTNLESFHNFVPKDVLPKDYEGTEPSMDEMQKSAYKKLCDSRLDTMKLEKHLRVNESLRPGKPKNASDLFGIEGNFKKLDFD